MRLAGLDPSLSNLGMAKGELLFEGSLPRGFDLTHLQLAQSMSDTKTQKVVRKNSVDLERAKTLYTALHDFIADVDMVMVEIPVGSQSARAMASYGICIGILSSIQKPLIQVTPNEVKLAACSTKTATKQMMIDWATNTFPDAPWLTKKQHGEVSYVSKNEHLADALAAIVAGVQTDTFKQLLAFRGTL